MNQKNIIINALSKLELEILKFIHDFGFCEIHHIKKRFNLGRSSAYGYMKILIRFGLVKHLMVLHNRPGVYYLTPQAVRLILTDLPVITQIPRHHYLHHMTVIDAYLSIRHLHYNNVWVSERKLLCQKNENMVGTKEHLPDGVFILPDAKRIPIEVELSLKTRERLRTILTDYSVDKDVQEVWYFCAPNIKKVIEAEAIDLPKIKVYVLNEVQV